MADSRVIEWIRLHFTHSLRLLPTYINMSCWIRLIIILMVTYFHRKVGETPQRLMLEIKRWRWTDVIILVVAVGIYIWMRNQQVALILARYDFITRRAWTRFSIGIVVCQLWQPCRAVNEITINKRVEWSVCFIFLVENPANNPFFLVEKKLANYWKSDDNLSAKLGMKWK